MKKIRFGSIIVTIGFVFDIALMSLLVFQTDGIGAVFNNGAYNVMNQAVINDKSIPNSEDNENYKGHIAENKKATAIWKESDNHYGDVLLENIIKMNKTQNFSPESLLYIKNRSDEKMDAVASNELVKPVLRSRFSEADNLNVEEKIQDTYQVPLITSEKVDNSFTGKIHNNAVASDISSKKISMRYREMYSDVERDLPLLSVRDKHKTEVIDGVTYIDGIMIVNKTYPLPASYNPGGLSKEVKNAFAMMQKAAAAENLRIYISSGFRSYKRQENLYKKYSRRDGSDVADTYSARPGYSEHQTGLCIDLNSISDSFSKTAESKWVSQHAHEYGFIVRFPEGKENVTGYKYESWHLRYIGIEKATEVYNSGLCLEEYLGISSAYVD